MGMYDVFDNSKDNENMVGGNVAVQGNIDYKVLKNLPVIYVRNHLSQNLI